MRVINQIKKMNVNKGNSIKIKESSFVILL